MDIKSILSNIFQFAKNNQFRVKLDDTLDLEPIREALADRQNSDELLKSLLVTQNAMLVRDKVEEADKKIEITNKSFEKAKKELDFTREEIEKLDAKVKELNNFKGEKGDSPSLQELREIIEPLILPPIKGDPGKDYVLTSKDKKEIAKSIKVPIVEKIVETIIEKQPIVTNEIKEVAVTDTSEKIKEKLESLEGDERLDAKAIKNLPKPSFGGGIKRIDGALDTRIISPTNGQALVWNSSRQVWENSSVSGGSGTPGGSDTQVQFNDGGSFGGDAGLVYNKTTNALTVGGDVELTSENSVDGTKRLLVSSYERAVSPTHYGEVIRADWKAKDAKIALAFRDDATNPGTPVSKGWLLAHDYLQYTNAAYTKTFVDADVNTSADRITVTGHGFTNGDAVKLFSTGTLPTGVAHLRQYYAKVIDANTLELHRDSGLTLLINITAASGGGTHSIADVTLGNNPHRHMSLEVTDSSGALQTRMEFPYDKDTTWVKLSSAHLVVDSGNRLYLVGENGSNKEIAFGLDETSVYTRWSLRQDTTTESGSNVGSDFQLVRYSDAGVALDSPIKVTRSSGLVTLAGNLTSTGTTMLLDSATTATVASDRGATTSFSSIVLRTAGTDEWSIQLRNDSTNNLYIRDNINGVNILQAAQGATPAVTAGGAWTFSNDATVPDEAYGAGWNGSLEVPTKNSVYDKIETLQPLDSELTALAGLTSAANKVPMFSGSGTATLLDLDTDLASVSASDDSVPSAKATKAMGDLKLPLAGGTMSGNITLGENTSIALDPAGSADGKYSGITVTGTGGATIAFGDLVTLDKDDSRWELVDISAAAAATGDARGIIGIAVTSSTDGGALTILLQGIIRADANFPALTIGAPVYASTTGDVVVTQPTTTDHVIRVVGFALTADEMFFNPSADYTTHI